jgi:hypothetical protein
MKETQPDGSRRVTIWKSAALTWSDDPKPASERIK